MAKIYKANIWDIVITKTLFGFVPVYIFGNYMFFSSEIISWISILLFNIIAAVFFITTPLLHYFYIIIDKELIIFHNPYLFGFKRKYKYSKIKKITIWYPLDPGQISGFRVHTKKKNYNYYSVGLVRHRELKEVIDTLMGYGIIVEVISKNEHVIK